MEHLASDVKVIDEFTHEAMIDAGAAKGSEVSRDRKDILAGHHRVNHPCANPFAITKTE